MNDLIRKVKIKLKNLFAPNAIVTPSISKDTWEKQYSSGAWDYLESEKEKEHYSVILEFFSKYANKGDVFDLGCGKGVLYNYMKQSNVLEGKSYYGVDISENAIASAKEQFGADMFGVLNYQTESIDRKFNCVIFNETLYYFEGISDILKKCFDENVSASGIIIVSMVKYAKHHLIWDIIDSTYHVLDEKTVTNEEGNSWTIKAFVQKGEG